MVGTTFTAVVGTALHFLYQWTRVNFVTVISAVNESTWEHMKLVFIPSFIFAVIQSCVAKKDYECFWVVKLIGILLGTLLIPILFYTLSGAFGTLSAITNVAIFFVAVFVEYLTELFLFNKFSCKSWLKWVSISALLFIFVLFAVFTFYPPKIPLFLDPITNGYGIER